jgi:hypothetical protein
MRTAGKRSHLDRRSSIRKHVWDWAGSFCRQLFPIALVAAVCTGIGGPANAIPDHDVDRSVLIVKLAPVADAAHKIALGSSGRTRFDAALSNLAVTGLKQVFPPLPKSHRLSSLAQERRMADYVKIGVPPGVDPDAMKKQLEILPDVESVEFDVIRYVTSPAVTPNDPYFTSHQYPLRNTGVQPPVDHGTSGADAEMQAAAV